MADDWKQLAVSGRVAQEQISKHLDGFFTTSIYPSLALFWELDITNAGRHLLALWRNESDQFLVLDPSAAAFGGNENSRNEVRRFMSYLDGWAREQGCTVLIIAHPAKGEGEAADYSGSTDWHNAARALWTLGKTKDQKDQKNCTTLSCIKINAAPQPKELALYDWKWWGVVSNADKDRVGYEQRH